MITQSFSLEEEMKRLAEMFDSADLIVDSNEKLIAKAKILGMQQMLNYLVIERRVL